MLGLIERREEAIDAYTAYSTRHTAYIAQSFRHIFLLPHNYSSYPRPVLLALRLEHILKHSPASHCCMLCSVSFCFRFSSRTLPFPFPLTLPAPPPPPLYLTLSLSCCFSPSQPQLALQFACKTVSNLTPSVMNL